MKIYEKNSSIGKIEFQAMWDGKVVVNAVNNGNVIAADLGPQRLKQAKGDIEYHFGGKIGLIAEEAAQLTEAISKAWWELATDEAKLDRLIEIRRRLTANVAGWEAEQAQARNKAWEDEDEAGAFAKPFQGKIDAALAELAAFDGEHPEVLEEIAKRQEEKANQHMWD